MAVRSIDLHYTAAISITDSTKDAFQNFQFQFVLDIRLTNCEFAGK